MQLIRDNTRVDLEWIGEGYSGEYDEDDPLDEKLMRFDVFRRESEDAEWEEVPDSSYCTQLPDSLSDELKQKALERIMDDVYGYTGSIKRRCEELSWISPEWLS